MIPTLLSIIIAVSFMFVMFGDPFSDLFEKHSMNYLGKLECGIRVYSFDNENVYFYEFPYGLSGVIYEGDVYFYDSAKVSKCSADSNHYDSVFHLSTIINNNNDKSNNKSEQILVSKCFLSEAIVRNIFESAPNNFVLPPLTGAEKLLLQHSQVGDDSFLARAKGILARVVVASQ